MTLVDNNEPFTRALARLGISEDEASSLDLKGMLGLLSSGPMLDKFSRIMGQRLLSRSNIWKPNDLTDLMFLTAAAGYADLVAAEKHTGNDLQQLERADGKSPAVATTLAELRDMLEGRL